MLKDIALKTGVIPQSLRDRPLIGEAEHFYVSCFYELNAFRGVGMTLQPLAIADIKAYIDILGGFTANQSRRFLDVIGSLDKTFIDYKIGQG